MHPAADTTTKTCPQLRALLWDVAFDPIPTHGSCAPCLDYVDDATRFGMKNASQDVEPPVYLLVGDADGHLSVLPARTDSKFFAIDVWKSSWKQQVRRPRVRLLIVVGARFGRPSPSAHTVRALIEPGENGTQKTISIETRNSQEI